MGEDLKKKNQECLLNRAIELMSQYANGKRGMMELCINFASLEQQDNFGKFLQLSTEEQLEWDKAEKELAQEKAHADILANAIAFTLHGGTKADPGPKRLGEALAAHRARREGDK